MSAQEEGGRAEARFAERLGMRLHPNSGATPRYMLDVGSVKLVVEHKWTGAESYRLTARELRKMRTQSRGPGARDVLPAHVVEMKGVAEPVWSFFESDLLAILSGDATIDLPVAKKTVQRAAAEPSFASEQAIRGEP